jgi:sigma-E factor negative regulatory protein RseB
MRRTLIFFGLVVAFTVTAVQVQAQNTDASLEQREASGLLARTQSAARVLNYAGTFVYQQGNQVRTSRITHIVDGRFESEKLEILDGKPREYIRNGDEITYYVPEAKTLVIEKRVSQEVFPAILAASPTELAEFYTIQKAANGRVAGFECQAVLLSPKDRLRYGYRLCAEKASGLLLRAQTLNQSGEVIEQIAFTQIAIGNIDRRSAKPSYVNTVGWHVENSITMQTATSGWTVRNIPPGFKKTRELKRLVSDTPAANALPGTSSNRREVIQIVYSDGLAAISVFVEPGTQSRTEGSLQQGAMNIVGKRQGDFWLTIVGEVPAAAITQVASSIEFKSK